MQKIYLVLIIFFLAVLTGQAQGNPQITVTLDDGMPYTPQNLSLGDVIDYTITVTNTGNMTLINVVVSDNNANISGNNNLGNMVAGQIETLYASHVVTQEDIDNGSVSNSAVAQGFFNGALIIDASDDIDPDSPSGGDDPTITHIAQYPQISVVKDDQLPNTPQNLNVGDVITYQILVTNTGNVTLNLVNITDNNATIISGNPVMNLEPGTTHVVTADHTVTQADIDAGQVSNQAAGTFDFQGVTYSELSDDNPSNTIPDEPTITILQTAGLDNYLTNQIYFYPAITTDFIYIVSGDLKIEKITFINANGQVQAELLYQLSGKYPVSGLAAGTYLLVIQTSSGQVVKRFFKQ